MMDGLWVGLFSAQSATSNASVPDQDSRPRGKAKFLGRKAKECGDEPHFQQKNIPEGGGHSRKDSSWNLPTEIICPMKQAHSAGTSAVGYSHQIVTVLQLSWTHAIKVFKGNTNTFSGNSEQGFTVLKEETQY